MKSLSQSFQQPSGEQIIEGGFDFSEDSDEKPFDIQIDPIESMKNQSSCLS